MPDTEDRILRELAEASELQSALLMEELQQNEGWKFLADKFSGFKTAATEVLGKRMMSGQAVKPEDIAFQRGYVHAIQDVFNAPKRLLREFESAAERALERAEEGLSEEPDERPYS